MQIAINSVGKVTFGMGYITDSYPVKNVILKNFFPKKCIFFMMFLKIEQIDVQAAVLCSLHRGVFAFCFFST